MNFVSNEASKAVQQAAQLETLKILQAARERNGSIGETKTPAPSHARHCLPVSNEDRAHVMKRKTNDEWREKAKRGANLKGAGTQTKGQTRPRQNDRD